MSIHKRILAAAIAGSLLADPASAELKTITIGTNPSGSTFFLIGSAMAKMFQEKLGIRSTAQPFAGSSMYVPAIGLGEMTMGVVNSIDAGLAYEGAADYPQEIKGLRSIAYVWEIPYGFVVRADSGIVTADDLKGKRIMGSMPTTQALNSINMAIVESGGLSADDVTMMESGGLMDGLNALAEGRTDAAPMATTMPVLTELQAKIPGGMRVMANGSQGSADFFGDKVSGLGVTTAKETETRPFIMGDTDIVTYGVLMTVGETMSDDDAYQLTKAIYDNWAELQANAGPLRAVPQDGLVEAGMPIPWHPGAIQFFKEAGLWTDQMEAAQQAF